MNTVQEIFERCSNDVGSRMKDKPQTDRKADLRTRLIEAADTAA